MRREKVEIIFYEQFSSEELQTLSSGHAIRQRSHIRHRFGSIFACALCRCIRSIISLSCLRVAAELTFYSLWPERAVAGRSQPMLASKKRLLTAVGLIVGWIVPELLQLEFVEVLMRLEEQRRLPVPLSLRPLPDASLADRAALLLAQWLQPLPPHPGVVAFVQASKRKIQLSFESIDGEKR